MINPKFNISKFLKYSLIFVLSAFTQFAYTQDNTYKTEVDGVCGMCEDRIEDAATSLKFITDAYWDVDKKILEVSYTKDFDEMKLHKAIAKAGHDTEKIKATQKAYDNIHGCCKYRDEDVIKAHSSENDNDYTTKVDGVCGMCQDRIEEAVLSLDFITEAYWDVDKKLLEVTHTEDFDEIKLHQTIAKVGHDTEKIKASQEDYDNLHGCCKYRDEEVIKAHAPQENKEVASDELVIIVSGNCEMCAERIEETAMSVTGVSSAHYHIDKQELHFTVGEDFNINELHQSIAAAGHDTDQLLADVTTYENLPGCCQYRQDGLKDDPKNMKRTVSGYIYEKVNGEQSPLELAEVYTVDNEDITFTNKEGFFQMEIDARNTDLIVSYIGYPSDTIKVSYGSEIEAVMSETNSLKEIVITYRRKTSGVSSLKTMKTFQVDESELLKAACCNLAESFETLPAVDVATTDAVTGTRQIKMLGLAGPNILYTREQIPVNHGISSVQGLTLIPGTWISSMQLNQGIGSAADGYESVSGQINVELRKPDDTDPLFVNIYGNEGGRLEANVHAAHRFNEQVSTALLLHGNMRNSSTDRNEDTFKDEPTGDGFSIANRWKLRGKKGLHSQVFAQYSQSNTLGGQVDDIPESNRWVAQNNVEDLNGFFKMGYLNPENPHTSLGLKVGGGKFKQASVYGNRVYNGEQTSANAQLIMENSFGSEVHKLRSGVGYKYQDIEESLDRFSANVTEQVPHIFTEYTYRQGTGFSAVLGLRYDYHNIYGNFFTPRAHLQYRFENGLSFRVAAGQAKRVASVLVENISALSSSRELVIDNEDGSLPTAPLIQSQNYSFSGDYGFDLFGRDATVSLDYYYTLFDKNVVVDYDNDINKVQIYNQKEKSYSHNAQAQIDFRPIDRMDIRLAYKWQLYNVGYKDGLMESPFTPRNRFFINAAYATKNDWAFDVTFNLMGHQRIPNTEALPTEMQMDEYSPVFTRINAQISKEIFDGFTLYAGVENLTNYRQEYAIIDAENPFGQNFDASMIWGPVMGRNTYAGIRYTIIKKKENPFKVK